MVQSLNMAIKLAVLAFLLLITASMGKELRPQALADPLTKYVKNVPIYNYHFAINFKDHLGREARCTTWIVKAHQEFEQLMRDVCASTPLGKRHCKHVIQSIPAFVFNGTEEDLNMMLDVYNHMIEFVEPDSVVWAIEGPQALDGPPANATPELPGTMNPQSATWGLDRIDQRSGIGGTYTPWLDGGRGTGVHVYVLDTGIMTQHSEFEGRAIPTFDIASTGSPTVCWSHDSTCAYDRNGHGSHCAGIIGGKTYGVAKTVAMHAVKVLSDSGSGQWVWSLTAMDWVATNAKKPAVVSMSLGGPGRMYAIQSAVNALVDRGITVVVAAGNLNMDACNYSPAFVPNAITVGATDAPVYVGAKYLDVMAYYSSYGSCLDMWAPGSDITSVGIRCSTCTASLSGTSMACPHVAGAAALVMGAYGWQPPQQLKALLAFHASRNTMGYYTAYPKPNSPLYILYVGTGWGGALSYAGAESVFGFPTKSMLQPILSALIAILLVVGIVSGTMWHKSIAAREMKTKPLLG